MPNSTRTSSPDPATEKNAPPDVDIDLEKVPTTGEPVVPQPSTKPTFPETDLDRGIIGWDGQDDPAHPQNFASGRKWALLAVVSTISFISPLASSMFSPALRSLSEDFDEHDQTILSFTVSIFLLGYTVCDAQSGVCFSNATAVRSVTPCAP
jgi:hypothetical protein